MNDIKVVSFSGGESSGEALKRTLDKHDNVIVVFMNTSKEKPQTLEFVDRVNKEWNVNVIWLEATFNDKKSTGYRITSYEECYKNGEVFEQMIKCYGLPNKAYPHCNRELKVIPFQRYIKDLNLGLYDTVLGIRADEVDRVNAKYKELRLEYPLVKQHVTKQEVNSKWNDRPFRLELKGYEGNCNKCWKKSFRKLMTIEKDEREGITPVDDWWDRMEEKYGYYVPEHRKRDWNGERITFYRKNKSLKEIREQSLKPFTPATDDAIIYDYQTSMFGVSLDYTDGCLESCEVIPSE